MDYKNTLVLMPGYFLYNVKNSLLVSAPEASAASAATAG